LKYLGNNQFTQDSYNHFFTAKCS